MHQSLSELEIWYPQIADNISLLWGTDELTYYFNNLLLQDDKLRMGFPYVVMSELFMLQSIHNMFRPIAASDVWTTIQKR